MYKNTIVSCLLLFIISSSALSQESFRGKLENYDKGKADIVTGMMGFIEVGEITPDGTFIIPLPEDFLQQMQTQIEKENAESKNWSSKMLSLKEAFSCSGDSMEYMNADQPVAKLFTMGTLSIVDVGKKKFYGNMMVASSREFSEAINSFGKKTYHTGYYLDWFFVKKPALVKGSCGIKSFTGNGQESFQKAITYDLDLKPGWNLVKYEIEKIFTGENDKTFIQEFSYKTLDKLPNEVTYQFFKEEEINLK